MGCDMKSMQVQLALIEIAKVMQKIANMACMVESDMEVIFISRTYLLTLTKSYLRLGIRVVRYAMAI